jgi:hypothetical protein
MNQPWYSISWFSPQQWQQFHFENRLVLYAILGFALLFLVRSALNGRARQQLALSSGTKVGNPDRFGPTADHSGTPGRTVAGYRYYAGH